MKNIPLLLLVLLMSACVSSNGIDVKQVDDTTFDSEDIENVLDHSAWDELLKKHVVSDGLVDYKGFQNDVDALNAYVSYLADQVPSNRWSTQEQLAYFINVYNANTIKLIVEHYPVASIKDVDATISPFLKNFIKIGTKDFSLADIEKGILQKMNEPRIHFAINCASFSCPKLLRDAYTAKNVNELMERAASEFINSDKNDISKNKAELSEIFKWYKSDFLADAPSIISYVNRYSDVQMSDDAVIDFKPYNWDLNDVD